MKKVFVLLIVVLLFTGCSSTHSALPDLTVMGDIEKEIKLHDTWWDKEQTKHKVTYDGKKIDAINVDELLGNISLLYKSNNVFLKAVDGFMIELNQESLQDCYIGYSKEHKWVFISQNHPVNSRIKNISEIVIVNDTDEVNYDYGLSIIHNDSNIHYTMGELLTSGYTVESFSDGVSSKKVDGKRYEVNVMQQRKIIDLTDFVDEDIKSTLVMTKKGEYDYNSGSGIIEIGGDDINFILEDNTYRDIAGIIINPPQKTVMDAYYDALHYLEQDDDVMIIFIDGFSYLQYNYIKNNCENLFLSNIDNVYKANTVYKPVTNAGFAAMITGESPQKNGVLNREYRELKVPTIFDKAEALDKKTILIEGDINILNTKLKPQLNIDKNKNGSKDDEIYNNALDEIGNNHNFFFVHFHSVDEFGHEHGDLDINTIDSIKVIDGYVESLVSKWSGKVIIVSDHGMHKTSDGGSHGEFRREDLFVPYTIIDGGKNQ